ncbi:unnamed protein product [Chironomus riparius]|uniref:Uncharacterized protein n=1 Tax=Chironomus riparius TaxID=315576 RepID=A0A9N9S0U5_9DIPT|nr:unnamed protein product [Chironomus riparius]
MRFMVVLVIFSVIAYSSCYEDAEADPLEEFDPAEISEEELEEITFLGDKLRKCVEKYCAYRCRMFMKPPYAAVCENSKCRCRKIQKQ